MAAVLFASCLVLTVDVLRVSTQFTGTEMPCEDLSPSDSTPTSGRTRGYLNTIDEISHLHQILI